MLSRAAVALRAQETVITTDAEGSKRITAISNLRLAFFLAVMLLKALVAFALGVAGTYFLTNTITIKDLLLNTAALVPVFT